MRLIFAILIINLAVSAASAAIYGADDRQDVLYSGHLKLAEAVAAAVPNRFIHKNSDGTFRIEGAEIIGGSSGANLCPDERFSKQTTLGNCTGFLISDRYLVTAGHCGLATGVAGPDVNNPFCKAFGWYFKYSIDNTSQTTDQNIPADDYYTCKKLIRAENIELPGPPGVNYGNDFAIIELNRPVRGITPLKINSNRNEIKTDRFVYTIGHPLGLPAKYSGRSQITNNQNPYAFSANLDTAGGNSGSPVFNDENEVIGILVGGHPIDLYIDKAKNCQRMNICNLDGSACNEQSKFEGLTTSNSIQYLDIVMRWLPRK